VAVEAALVVLELLLHTQLLLVRRIRLQSVEVVPVLPLRL
jgi:hypothetical protein